MDWAGIQPFPLQTKKMEAKRDRAGSNLSLGLLALAGLRFCCHLLSSLRGLLLGQVCWWEGARERDLGPLGYDLPRAGPEE